MPLWKDIASAEKQVPHKKVKDGKYLENNHIVSFIGFAPADDPSLVVYVAVDNPKGTIQFGGNRRRADCRKYDERQSA